MPRRRPIHERVKEFVDLQGLTYAEIARRTGWHELRVARLLTGKTDISADDMEVFAEILRRPVADLYRGAPRSVRAL